MKTTIGEAEPEMITYLFDRAGRTVSAVNEYGEAASTSYTSENKPQYSANAQVVRNLLQNPSFEYDDKWDGAGSATEDALMGGRAFSLASGDKKTQRVTLSKGVYTLSVFAKGDQGQLTWDFSSGDLGAYETAYSEQWERFSTTFEIKNQTSGTISMETLGEFTQFDGIQLEQSGGANPYNYVEDSHFDFGSILWTIEDKENSDKLKSEKGDKYYVIYGDPYTEKALAQKVVLNAREGQMVTFGARASASAVSTGKFQVVAKLYDADGNKINKTYSESFNVDIRPTKGAGNTPEIQARYAQTAMTSIALPQDCSYMELFICYYNQAVGEANSMKIYDSFVFLGTGGTEYNYSDDGVLESSVSDAGMVTYAYVPDTTEIQSVTAVRPNGRTETVSVEYQNHNIKSITKGDLITEYEYAPVGGVVTDVITTEDGTKTVQSVGYTNDFNHIKSQTDASGATATFKYDDNGNIKEATGFDGSELAYTFETKDLLQGVGKKTLVPSDPQNAYDYNASGQVTESKHNGTAYSFAYDDVGQLTEASIGGKNILTNTFNSKYQLERTLFAGGALGGYEPKFDDRNRLVAESFSAPSSNDYKTSFRYAYSDSGALTQATNVDAKRTSQFSYDMTGNLTDVVTTNTDNPEDIFSRIRMEYDSVGLLGHLRASANGIRLTDSYYSYDEQQRPYEVEMLSLDDTKLTYDYTTLNRLLGKTLVLPDGTEAVTSYGYLQQGNGMESNYVTDVQNHIGGAEVDYKYAYDTGNKNANIKTVQEKDAQGAWQTTANYTYDKLGQLTSDGTYDYKYTGNNLTEIKTGLLATERKFTYDDSGDWKDQLVSVEQDGETKAITYDDFGNLSNFDG